MTFREHDIEIDHLTMKDDLAVHQVRFKMAGTHVAVTCVCRTKPGQTEYFGDGSRSLSPIALSHDLKESRELYNDPKNHWAPFTEKDKAKW